MIAIRNGRQFVANADQHQRVNTGRRHMSNAETRVSVIVGVCRRDPERWRDFDAIYRPILLAYLLKRGLEESEASDVVQDIFVKLLGKIGTYDRARGKFRTWLFRIAHNTLIDHARRRAAYNKAKEGWVAHVLTATLSESQRMAEQWAKIHCEKILEHALKTVRKRTSSKAWACFEQRLLRDRPAAAIAAELKIEPNGVYVYASRVLKQVRDLCEEFDEDISHALKFGVS
jgi:RNA polymerase sigma factor (sigma-70 family)